MPLPVSPMPDTKSVAGSAAAPTAATVVITMTPASPGVYEVLVNTQQAGTVDAVNNNVNMSLNVTSTKVSDLVSASAVHSRRVSRVSIASGDTINVKATSNAGASSIYIASLDATMVDTNVSTASNAANYR